MAATLVITEWRAALHPGNRAYILKSQPAARAGLLRLLEISNDAARQRIQQACNPALRS